MESKAEIRELSAGAHLQLIQNGIATEITETPIRQPWALAGGLAREDWLEGGCHEERALCRADGAVVLGDSRARAYRHRLRDARSRPVVAFESLAFRGWSV